MKPLFALSASVLLFATSCTTPPTEETPAPANESAQSPRSVDASGYSTTTTGLRYKVLSSGPAGGRPPASYDTVIVHYRGTLSDGSVFDSSYDRGTPATFDVGRVIPGWTEALQLMKPGDKWQLKIPHHLAYGERGMPPKIPPYAELTFEVQLIQVLGAF